MHYLVDNLVLHQSNSLDALLGQFSRAFFEERKVCLTYLALFSLLFGRVSLLNEVDEGLSFDKSLEKRLVFLHVLHIVLEIEDVVCAVSLVTRTKLTQSAMRLCMVLIIVEVLECVDQENEEIEELLLDFESKLLPEHFLSLPPASCRL